MQVGVALRYPKTKPRIRDGKLGVAAVELIAGKPGGVAKVFPPRLTIGTAAARSTEPGDSNSLAGFKAHNLAANRRYGANNLMARYEREFRIRQFSINHVEISAANRAGADSNQNLIRFRLRNRNIP
jgi:hypothetical protein